MHRLGILLSLWAVAILTLAPIALAEEKQDGALIKGTASPTTVGGHDGTNFRAFRTDSDGYIYARDPYPPSESAPVRFSMANGADVTAAQGGVPFEIGSPWLAAGDFYNKGLMVAINTTTPGLATPIEIFLKVSHTGSESTFDFVTFNRDSLGQQRVTPDTLKWATFRFDSPDTSDGRGIWCGIPLEAQQVVNAAQAWKVAVRFPSGYGHTTFWISGVGKR